MLETVIGAVAVVFVTTMIIWMNQHAFQLKGELEREAQRAVSSGSSFALVAMAFLAVLKEGFETAVFMLAAVQASGQRCWGCSAPWPASCAPSASGSPSTSAGSA